MVISGKYKVKRDLGAEIGSGFAQGLATSLPKAIEQRRLAEGLQRFEKESAGLTPLQQYTRLLQIPGLPAQAIQQMPEILKQQGVRNAYLNNPKNEELEIKEPEGQLTVEGEKPRNINEGRRRTIIPGAAEPQGDIVRPGETGQPAIQETNPLRPAAAPRKPWTNQRLDRQITENLQSGKASTVQEAFALAKEQEQRELSQPAAEQAADQYYREKQDEADAALQKKLATKLEVENKGENGQPLLFKDLSGETLNNLNRNMYKDLRTSGPDVSIEDVAEYWSEKGLDLVKAKDKLKELQGKSFLNKLTSGAENLEKLKSHQKIFAETGNEEEFYNTLRTGTESGGFGLSPQAAATVAFPLSSSVKNYINKSKPTKTSDVSFVPAKSRKYAVDLEKIIRPEDSFLAIARELRQKDPGFDQRSFFSQLREDQDTMAITPRQKRELTEGESDVFLNWSDLLYFPLFRD